LAGRVTIEGLAAFRKALAEVDRKWDRELAKYNFHIAEKLVKYAKGEADTRFSRSAAQSLRATRSAAAATVEGGRGKPFFFAAEFGARRRSGWYARKRYRDKGRDQFPEWRGNQFEGWEGGPGYFLHPAIRDHADSLIDEYERELDKLYGIAFPE
jgi:hypothetical protein